MAKHPSEADLALIDPDGSFRARLRHDYDALRGLAARSDLRELETIVHRLAGAAATFGYAEIGEIATTLDDAFIRLREGGGTAPDVGPLTAAISEELARR